MRIFALALALVMPLLACADGEPTKPKFEEGKDYVVLSGQPKPSKSGPIEVTEVFWYGCGHCYQFENLVGPWKKNLADDVEFIQSPAIWNDMMRTHAQLYYTAASLEALDKLHPAFFDAMHKKNMRLTRDEEIAKVVSQHGVDGDVFVKTMDSFAVNAQVTQADKRQRAYKVSGTPEMVVAGYYHVGTAKAGSQKRMLEVVDFLIEKVREER